jgi:hypothetical protein
MTTFLAVAVFLFFLAGIVVLIERNNRRANDLPRVPFGADVSTDADLLRLRHDLDVARAA